MLMSKFRAVLVGTLALVVVPAATNAQDFPTQPVTIVLADKIGGVVDTIARVFGDQLSEFWNQKIVVRNEEDDLAAAKIVAKGPKDGSMLFVTSARTYTVLPIEQDGKMGINLQSSLVPVGLLGEQPVAVAVSKDVAAKSVPELIALTKSAPEAMKYTAGMTRGQAHLAGDLFREKTKANIRFEASPDTLTAVRQVMDKHIPIIFDRVANLAAADFSGRVDLLAIAASKRMVKLPDVPTINETVPGLVATDWVVLLAPEGTPDAIVQKINADLRRVTAERETVDWLTSLGTVSRDLSPRETADFILAEQRTWWPVTHRLKE